MKSHVKLFASVLTESGRDCGVSTRQDLKRVLSRLSKEGESFLTISLPAYEKSLLRALDEGKVSSDHFHGFRRSGGLPVLFRGFLRIIFDDHGVVRPTTREMVIAIKRLRQILLVLSKIEMDCAPEREAAAIAKYRVTDRDVPTELVPSPNWDPFYYQLRDSFEYLFREYLDDLERRLYKEPFFRGGHGPGAVADRTTSNKKWALTQWTDRLEAVVPVESTLACNLHDYLDQEFTWLPVGQEPPVRVVTVPKTMKGPRVIAVEPTHMQYVQQGLFRMFTEVLLENRHAGLNARLGWTDQEPNRALAKDHVNYATIDLSEASDRVPFALVDFLFESRPLLHEVLLASRSLNAELPDGSIIPLRKFASMGSAMCFPIESMVFATCIAHAQRFDPGWSSGAHLHSTASRRLGSLPMWRVFGDDMVVPKHTAPFLEEILETIGLVVNTDKSFLNGKFRESCGADWYDGFDVSVVKCRSPFPISRRDTAAIIKGISLHNRLFEAGMFESAQTVEAELLRARPMFYAPPGSDVLALWTFDSWKVDWKVNRNTQKMTLRAYKPSFVYRLDELDGYGALRKFFHRADEWASPWDDDRDGHILKRVYPQSDPDHLRYSGRPLRVAINAGYVSPDRKSVV